MKQALKTEKINRKYFQSLLCFLFICMGTLNLFPRGRLHTMLHASNFHMVWNSSELGDYLLSKYFSIKKQPTTRTKQINIHQIERYWIIHLHIMEVNTEKNSEKKSYDSSSHHSDSIWMKINQFGRFGKTTQV